MSTRDGSPKKKGSMSIDEILAHVQPTPIQDRGLTVDQKVEIIATKFHDIMETLGLDMNHESLKKTPKRIAKMYVNEVFAGLQKENFPRISTIPNDMDYDQMIVIENIKVLSVCEHHFQTIDGIATVAYIPGAKVIGLSKINRIVEYFARRPQVQERLTKQIADCMQSVLETDHVAVHISAKHYCVIARGVEDANSSTSTSDLRGDFRNNTMTRTEFLKHCRLT